MAFTATSFDPSVLIRVKKNPNAVSPCEHMLFIKMLVPYVCSELYGRKKNEIQKLKYNFLTIFAMQLVSTHKGKYCLNTSCPHFVANRRRHLLLILSHLYRKVDSLNIFAVK